MYLMVDNWCSLPPLDEVHPLAHIDGLYCQRVRDVHCLELLVLVLEPGGGDLDRAAFGHLFSNGTNVHLCSVIIIHVNIHCHGEAVEVLSRLRVGLLLEDCGQC